MLKGPKTSKEIYGVGQPEGKKREDPTSQGGKKKESWVRVVSSKKKKKGPEVGKKSKNIH